MKKRLLCFTTALLLLLSAAGTVFASAAEQTQNPEATSNASGSNTPATPTSPDTDLPLAPTASLQLMFAAMQLELAETVRTQADEIARTAALQETQKQAFDFLNIAIRCQTEARSTGVATRMPDDMLAYMDANALAYDTTGNDLFMTHTEWDVAIDSLSLYIEQLAVKVHQQMILTQTYIGQYNSYLQNVNTQSSPYQTLTGLSKGMTIYDNSEAGLTVTALIVGLALGSVLTLAVQKLRRKQAGA